MITDKNTCFNISGEMISKWKMCNEPVQGFPSGSVGKKSTCSAGNPGSIPVSGRSLREGNGNPLQYSCLGNLTDRGAWQDIVHEVTKELDSTKEMEQQQYYFELSS